MANQLMFEVGIKEADNQLTELERRLKNIVSNYGKLELKVQVDGLKAFTTALESIGQSKGLEALQKRIDVLQVTLANIGMSGAKSMQEFEAAVKTTSAVAEQYTQRINQMTAARDKFANGSTQWMSLNNKLTDFQNDKQVIAIYAQEQVAIKNLEDAKARLSNTNAQEVESYQKVISSIETLSTAANTLKTALGTWDASKGNIAQLIEQFEKLHKEISGIATSLKGIDPSKLNFSGLNINVGNITGLGNLSDAIRGLEVSINDIIRLFSNLANAVKLQPLDDQVKALLERCERAETKLREVGEAARYLNERAGERTQQKSQNIAGIAGLNEENVERVSNLFERYRRLLADVQNQSAKLGSIQNIAEKLGLNPTIVDQASKRFEALWKTIENSMVGMEKYKGFPVLDATSDQLSKLRADFSALLSEYKLITREANNYNKVTEKGSSQAEARIRKLGMAFNELKNYMKANGGSEEMKRLQIEIQGAIRKMRDLMNAGKFGEAINVYERLSGIIRQAASATKDFERAQHSVSSTVSHTNTQLLGQSQILSDLKSMAMQYLSVWGASNFIHNIIELGGQLEQQRLSIGAILQDTAQANHLFSQIKDLAIKSPFGVQQLDQMSKQLTAYGFQYSELYDWTKRLADISAATGTSVDRLALALGHVRSEGALSGYTLRQFSMGNIPLLQKLSENLGKTKQEIRKMTRNKEIGYEDVLDVLRQLTDESGMFYNAQEVMSEALNAKFKNLRDSFQIMYSEMAEGAPGDFLKGFATTMTELSRQWQILLPMIGAAGAMWAMNRASAVLVNVELAKMASLTNANTLASSKYSVAQLRQIANWEKMPHAMVRARLALQGFKTALLSLGRIVFSWPTAIFAAIEALTYMWAKQSRESEKAKEMAEVLSNTAIESQKNLGKQLSNIGPYQKGMSDSEMKTGIDSMTEAIKNYGVNAQEVLETVYGKDAEGRVMSLADRYKYLREELEKTNDVYKEMQRTTGGIEFGVEFSDGGWLDDDVQTDLTNYAEAVKEYEKAFITMTANYSNAVNKALEVAKKASPAFSVVAEKLASDAERIKFLYEHQDFYGNEYNIFKSALHQEDPNAGGGVLGYALGENLRKAEQEAMKELDQFLKGTEEWFKKYGYDFSENGKNLSETQVGNLLKQSKEWLEKHPEWENIYSVIWDKLNKRWGIPIVPDVTGVEEELPQWMVDFQKELDKTGIKLTATMSMEQIVDEMKKAYDKAQTTINKLGPIAMQAKIDIKGLTDENIEQYKFLNPELYETLKDLKKAQESKDQVETAGKKRGLNFKGMKKDGTHKKEKQNTEAAKAVREQVRVIKAAADAFQYWREKVGDKGAWEHVQSEFGDVLAKIGITAQNIEDVRGHLKRIPEMKEYKAITDKKVKTEIKKEIAKDEDQFIRKDFERDTERFLSRTQIELDNLTRSWETFNSVREATGNVELAIELSGAKYESYTTRNLADAVRHKIESDFASAGVPSIPFNINIDNEQLEKDIQDTFSEVAPKREDFKTQEEYNNALTAHEKKIKAFVEQYKKWRDLQRDVKKNAISVFANLKKDVDSVAQKMRDVNDEFAKYINNLDYLKENGFINQEQYNEGERTARNRRNTQVIQNMINGVDWNASFTGIGHVLEASAKEMYKQLMEAIKAPSFANLEYSQQIAYTELADKLRESGVGSVSPFNLKAWGQMGKLAKDYQDSVNRLLRSVTRLDNAQKQLTKAKKAEQKAVTKEEKEAAKKLLEEAQKAVNEAAQEVSNDQTTVIQSGAKLKSISELAAKGLQIFSDTLSQITSGSVSGFALGMANLVRQIGGKDKVSNVSEIFGKSNTKWGGIVGAILQIIDALGEDPLKFVDDIFDKVAKAIEKVLEKLPDIIGTALEGIVNVIGSVVQGVGGLFGIDFGFGGADYSGLEKAKATYEGLVNVWDDLIDRKKTYMNQSWGGEALNAAKEATELLRAEIEQAKIYGRASLDSGASAGSHSIRYRMWNGSYEYNGMTWDDVNREISKTLNVTFNGMDDMLEMSSKQLLWIKENYTGLWAVMDDDFRNALEDIIKYSDELQDVLDAANEKLNGLSYEGLINSYYNFVTASQNANDVLADDLESKLKEAIVKGMIENLYQDRIKAITEKANELGRNTQYVDNNGRIRTHSENPSQDDVASEYTKEEYDLIKKMAEALGNEEQATYEMLKAMYGWTDDNSSSSSASSSIKGTTEQTADLLASYLNATRASTANIENLSAQYFPMFYAAMTSGNANLRNIENHTDAIMRSNDIIAEKITRLDEDVHGLRTNVWRMPLA